MRIGSVITRSNKDSKRNIIKYRKTTGEPHTHHMVTVITIYDMRVQLGGPKIPVCLILIIYVDDIYSSTVGPRDNIVVPRRQWSGSRALS